jgi:ketosteroid isomerase-like protein
MPSFVPLEISAVLRNWVEAIEGKDLDALRAVFRDHDELVVFWTNGERNVGWEEVRTHIEADLRPEVALQIEIEEPRYAPLGDEAGTLTFRYEIRLTVHGDSTTLHRLASMSLHREAQGWRIAALHLSTAPGSLAG